MYTLIDFEDEARTYGNGRNYISAAYMEGVKSAFEWLPFPPKYSGGYLFKTKEGQCFVGWLWSNSKFYKTVYSIKDIFTGKLYDVDNVEYYRYLELNKDGKI